jgi:hypothetical protein
MKQAHGKLLSIERTDVRYCTAPTGESSAAAQAWRWEEPSEDATNEAVP